MTMIMTRIMTRIMTILHCRDFNYKSDNLQWVTTGLNAPRVPYVPQVQDVAMKELAAVTYGNTYLVV